MALEVPQQPCGRRSHAPPATGALPNPIGGWCARAETIWASRTHARGHHIGSGGTAWRRTARRLRDEPRRGAYARLGFCLGHAAGRRRFPRSAHAAGSLVPRPMFRCVIGGVVGVVDVNDAVGQESEAREQGGGSKEVTHRGFSRKQLTIPRACRQGQSWTEPRRTARADAALYSLGWLRRKRTLGSAPSKASWPHAAETSSPRRRRTKHSSPAFLNTA